MFSRLQNHEQDNYRASLVAASLNYQGTSTFIISNTCQQEKKNRKIGKKKKKKENVKQTTDAQRDMIIT